MSGTSRDLSGEEPPVSPVEQVAPGLVSRLNAEALIERFRHLPAVDAQQLRADIDAVVDQDGIDNLRLVAVPHPDSQGRSPS